MSAARPLTFAPTDAANDAPPTSSDIAAASRALDGALDQAWIAFQPIVDNRERRTLGYEALLRTKDTTLRDPSAILDAAERSHRVHDVGARVRELVVVAFESAPQSALLFINLHPRDLADARLFDPRSPLARIADRVVLELTERSSIHDIADVEANAAALRALGFRMAVDDLGAGYAGLSSFAVIEPEIAKLDMSLVRSIHLSSVRQRVVASMLSLCRELGSRVVAEGVECEEERATLASLGCEWMQGYYFAKPGPPFPAAMI